MKGTDPFVSTLTLGGQSKQVRWVGNNIILLTATGDAQLGPEGRVEHYLDEFDLLCDEESSYVERTVQGMTPNFIYSGPLDKVEGYAQGMLDAFQISLGVAGRATRE